MATNFYTKFAYTTDNAKTDAELAATFALNGITSGSVAYTDVLNGILRQLSVMTHSIADFIVTHTEQDVDSSLLDENMITDALAGWVSGFGFAVDIDMPFIRSQDIDPGEPGQMTIWYGTEAQYDALGPSYDPHTRYFIY